MLPPEIITTTVLFFTSIFCDSKAAAATAPPGSTFTFNVSASIFIVSIYTFANVNMKTEDYYFRGFPAVWNIVVLYFYILGTHNYLNLLVIIVCLILTF